MSRAYSFIFSVNYCLAHFLDPFFDKKWDLGLFGNYYVFIKWLRNHKLKDPLNLNAVLLVHIGGLWARIGRNSHSRFFSKVWFNLVIVRCHEILTNQIVWGYVLNNLKNDLLVRSPSLVILVVPDLVDKCLWVIYLTSELIVVFITGDRSICCALVVSLVVPVENTVLLTNDGTDFIVYLASQLRLVDNNLRWGALDLAQAQTLNETTFDLLK